MESAYQYCEQLVREQDKDRFLASLFAPADIRRRLLALCAFELEVESVREKVRDPMAGEIRLQWWHDVLSGERAGEAAANPVALAVRDTIAGTDVADKMVFAFLRRHMRLLHEDASADLAALEIDAIRTSGSIFMAAAEVSGVYAPYAERAGAAWGIARSLRAFARRASRGIVFVPPDLRDKRGVSADDILGGRSSPQLRAALAEIAAVALRLVASFEEQLWQIPAAAMPAILPAALVPGYLAIMQRADYDPFRTAVEVPQWRRQWTLWRAARRWSRAMRG